MKNIPTLTGLRGVAILVIFCSHAAGYGYLPSYIGHGFGQIGVMLFFVLSGFLMAHLYLEHNFSRSNVINYIFARMSRVFPLYILVLIISFVISNYLYEDYILDFRDHNKFWLSLFLIKPLGIFWIVPAVVQFYVIFVVFWWSYKKSFSPLPLTLVILVLSFVAPILSYLSVLPVSLPPGINCFFSFFIGVTISVMFNMNAYFKSIRAFADFAGLPIFILFCLNTPDIRIKFGLFLHNNSYALTWLDPITWLLVIGLFICALLNSSSLQFLNWKPFAFIGKISFGIYLIHIPILFHTKDLLGVSNMVLVVVFFIVTILSFALSVLYEKPLASIIRQRH